MINRLLGGTVLALIAKRRSQTGRLTCHKPTSHSVFSAAYRKPWFPVRGIFILRIGLPRQSFAMERYFRDRWERTAREPVTKNRAMSPMIALWANHNSGDLNARF